MLTRNIKLPIHNENRMNYELTPYGTIKLEITKPVEIEFYKNPVRLSKLTVGDIFYKEYDGLLIVQSKVIDEDDGNFIHIRSRSLFHSNDLSDSSIYDKNNKHSIVFNDTLIQNDTDNYHYVLVCKYINLGIE